MRRGPNGGLLICEPDAGPATHAIIIYLEYLGTTIGDLLNARLVLEPLAASLAAEHIDEAGIERLRAVLRAEEHWKPGQPAPRDEFHVALAEQSKNPVLQLFIDILMRLTVRYAAGLATGLRQRSHRGDRPPCTRDHSAIVAAVTAGDLGARQDTERATRGGGDRMAADHHADDRRARQSAAALDRRGATGQARRGAGRRHPRRHRRQRLAGRRGLRHARSALLERYRVSRAVLREAVRLLEYHAVATCAAGPAAGWWSHEPQAQASIDTIALYLQYREPRREDLRWSATPSRSTTSPRSSKRHDAARGGGLPRHPSAGLPDDSSSRRRCPAGRRRGVPVPRRAGAAGRQRACWICSCGSSSSCSAGTGPAPSRRCRPGQTSSTSSTLTCGSSRRSGRRRQPGPLPHPPSPGRGRVLVAVDADASAIRAQPVCPNVTSRGIAKARLGYLQGGRLADPAGGWRK